VRKKRRTLMSGVSSELFNKIVAIICAIVFIVGVGSLVLYTLNSEARDEQQLEEIKKASMALELQKNQYTRELNNLEAEMLASLPCGSTLTLVTLSVDEDLYTLLYPAEFPGGKVRHRPHHHPRGGPEGHPGYLRIVQAPTQLRGGLIMDSFFHWAAL
jgi:hypothetical protein